MINSPVTGGLTKLVDTIDTNRIVTLYQREYNSDVSRFFSHAPFIEKRRCMDSGYKFYYPYSTQGDPEFYESLYYNQGANQSTDWAYSEFRFEFEWVKQRASFFGNRLLDIGAGSGAFLDYMEDTFVEKTGIETNAQAATEARSRGFTFYEEEVSDHKKRGAEVYDVVTVFQVLEHIHNVKEFLQNCLDLLTPGGVLIIAVPNNGGFVGKQPSLTLNLPPHHMGLWDSSSLCKLSSIFNMPLIALEEEPLQEKTVGWYLSWAENQYLPKSKIIRSSYYRFGGRRFFEAFVRDNRHSISGHTIVAAFQKVK